MAIEQLHKEAVEAVAPKAKAKRLRRPAKQLSADDGLFRKILAFAYSGRGKTFFLVGLLEAGLKVFVAETDIGGSGLSTVTEELKRRGKLHLLDNVAFKDFNSYEEFEEFIGDPGGESIVLRDGRTIGIWEWDPDFLVWEGFSNWQVRHLTDYILQHDARGSDSEKSKVSALREAGMTLEGYGDYAAVLTLTTRHIDKFLTIHNPVTGKRIHKYVTAQTDDGKTDDQLTGETKRGPVVMGRARSYMFGGFDLIIEIEAKVGRNSAEYRYKCELGGTSVAKNRGLNVNREEPANSQLLWEKIKPVPIPVLTESETK